MIEYVLLLLGVTYIITQSSILALVRQEIRARVPLLGVLVSCPACAAFWIGAVFGACGLWPFAVRIAASVDSAVAACALGALWAQLTWSALDQPGDAHDSSKEKDHE
jgi:hypothetical protein